MALSDLIARLEQEAQNQVQAIQRDADVEVRAMETATEHVIADLTARHLEHERAERGIVYQRELAQARRQARARELEARWAQLSRILERARTLVPEVGASPAYAESLPAHIDEALSFLEGLQPRVRCQPAFAPIARAAIARHGGAELVEDPSVGPGVVVEAADGSVVVDATLAARLARAEERLAIELLRQLGDAGQ
jgi:vacuolar-type H+-ATPase subunit E/Vma4